MATSPVARVVQYVEIDIDDACELTYGVSPCTATLEGEAPTGTFKCFNSRKTCQDIANFSAETNTLRFAVPCDWLDPAIPAIPSILSIEIEPGTISLGRDLGLRPVVRVTFGDHPWPDPGDDYDKYPESRDYVAIEQGTYFGKLRARHPYLQLRDLRLYHGEAGQALGEMELRHYKIEAFDGPTAEGTFVVETGDPLKFADGDRVQVPPLSPGFLGGSGIDADDTGATLSPAGVGDTDYPASGWVKIGGREVCPFTRSGDSLTLTRGQRNTTAVAHEAGEHVQLCRVYDGEDPAAILKDVWVNDVGLPESYTDIAAWTAETEAHYARVLTYFLATPVAARDFLGEVIETAGLAQWWSDLTRKIGLQVLRSVGTDAATFDEDHVLAESFRVREQPETRLSRVQVYFGQIDPTKPVTDEDNYALVEEVKDEAAETEYGSPAIRKIYARGIPPAGRATATRLGNLLLSRYRNPPRRLNFEILRPGASALALAGGYKLRSWIAQDAQGAAASVPFQVTRLAAGPAVVAIEGEEVNFTAGEDLEQGVVSFDVNENNINLRTVHDTIYGAPAAGDEITARIADGAIIGSAATSLNAFDVGDWPSDETTGDTTDESAVIENLADTSDYAVGMFVRGTGIPNGAKIASVDSSSQITLDTAATASGSGVALTVYTIIITVDLSGRIQGRGGAGGKGGPYTGSASNPGNPGGTGGPALRTRYPINLISEDGEIFAGGGGGGGGGNNTLAEAGGGGGGGGAGTLGGSGGPASGGSNQGSPGVTGTADAGGSGGAAGSGSTRVGGTGGAPGGNGSAGVGSGAQHGGAGGLRGVAIDGLSYVFNVGTQGDIRGRLIN
jgi:hypothetical protein